MSKEIINKILDMDSKSEDFFEVYKAVSNKYWTFENPDDLQQCAALMVSWAERFDADKVILATKLILEISKMVTQKTKAASLHLAFSEIEYYVDIASSEVEKDKLKGLMGKAMSEMEKGNVEIKDKFGKRYFNKRGKK